MEIINKSVVDELKAENERLLRQSIFTQKYLLLLEKYRSCLIVFCNYCKCEQNSCHKSKVSDLEKEYKNIANSFNENIRKDLSKKTERIANAMSRNNGSNGAKQKQSLTFIKSPMIRDTNKITTSGGNNNVENKDNKVILAAKRQKLDINIVNKNCANNSPNNSKKKANENFVFGSALLGGLLPTLKSNPVNIKKDELTKTDSEPRTSAKRKRQSSKTHQKISNEIRSKIIEALDGGDNFKNVSLNFNVKYGSVRNIFKVYQKEGRINKKSMAFGRKKILNKEQQLLLCDWYDQNRSLTLTQLRSMCLDKLEIKISIMTIDRILKRFNKR